MNKVEIVVYTVEGQDRYRIEERDEKFYISKYQRNILGFYRFRKLAQARSRDSVLKIIHILTAAEIIRLEINPADFFRDSLF